MVVLPENQPPPQRLLPAASETQAREAEKAMKEGPHGR
jgi:hypothetical protein